MDGIPDLDICTIVDEVWSGFLGQKVVSAEPEGDSVEFDFDEAGDGDVAIKKCLENKFDLVFIDINMPKVNGIEALSQIKRDCPNTSVIVMTADKSAQIINAARQEGAYLVLHKPIDNAKLQRAVRGWYENRGDNGEAPKTALAI